MSPLRSKKKAKSPKRPLPKAANSVNATASFYRKLGEKFEKYGARIAVVKMFPMPVFDIKIKTK